MRLLDAIRAFFRELRGESLPVIEGCRKDFNHLRLLRLLQEEGRLLDFLKEDISPYSDEQVGAVVRKLHEGCSRRLEDLVTIRPLLDQQEGEEVQVPSNSPSIRLVGEVTGNGPFTGVVRHSGWQAHKHSLPQISGNSEHTVLFPAEVEVTRPPSA
jgi:hypothetical protein